MKKHFADRVISLTSLKAPGDPICAFGYTKCRRPVEFRAEVIRRFIRGSCGQTTKSIRFFCAFHASHVAQVNRLVVNG